MKNNKICGESDCKNPAIIWILLKNTNNICCFCEEHSTKKTKNFEYCLKTNNINIGEN